jgi:hypothetical protein
MGYEIIPRVFWIPALDIETETVDSQSERLTRRFGAESRFLYVGVGPH